MTEEEIDFACRQLPGLCGWYSTSWDVRCVWPL
jgi:hypothetical protein